MNLQILISTMNKKTIDELNIKEKNILTNCLIINQTDKNVEFTEGKNSMISYNEKGLSKSRNRAIENASGYICIICDDDVEYIPGFEDIILNEFDKNPNSDVITFQIKTPEGDLFKKYQDFEFNHNKRSILRVSSIEVAFKLNSIKEKNIKFDELFGLGAKYASGEENIFLMDCLNKGLNIKYIPKIIAIHEKESSGKTLNEKAIYSKGALFYRLFGVKSIILNFLFIVKKFKIINFNIWRATICIYKGLVDYIRER